MEAEQATLGSMLLDRNALLKALEILRPEDFYFDSHRLVFEGIADLFETDRACDLVTLAERMQQKNTLTKAGGAEYLALLVNLVPTSANVEYYAHIVEEKSLARALITVCTNIIKQGYDGNQEATELLDTAQNLILQLSQKQIRYDFVSLKEAISTTFNKLEELYHRDEHAIGVPSGFTDLDIMTTGFHPSELIVIAARPGMGKTSLCLNMALHAGKAKKIPSAVFSLEMSRDQIAQRILCGEAKIDANRVRRGVISDKDWKELTNASKWLSETLMFIDDSPGISVLELRAKARRLKHEQNLGLVIVDYLQLMTGHSRSENRQQEISEISRSLKAMARELELPVIAVSQLSRAVESRSPKRPQLSDLRESGAIEQDADVVLFIYRDAYYNPESKKKGTAEIIVAKQRNGPIGTVELAFLNESTRFENLARKAPPFPEQH